MLDTTFPVRLNMESLSGFTDFVLSMTNIKGGFTTCIPWWRRSRRRRMKVTENQDDNHENEDEEWEGRAEEERDEHLVLPARLAEAGVG
jgi:hypothetical protein